MNFFRSTFQYQSSKQSEKTNFVILLFDYYTLLVAIYILKKWKGKEWGDELMTSQNTFFR